MTPIWNRVRGDVNDTVRVQLDGISSLSGATVKGHVWRDEERFDLSAVVDDPGERTVTVQLSPWLATASAGAWEFEVEVASAGRVLTWPDVRPARVVVREDGDPPTP